MTSDKLNKNTPWQDLTPGGEIYTAGNSMEFKTGDWRSVKPVFLPENVDYVFQYVQIMLYQ